MPTEVICPDCGKTIAPRGAIDELLRCKCAEKPSFNKKSDTVDDEIESFADGSAASKEKSCYVCGKSLAGRVRLKDHLGRYWCKQCASADKKAKRHEEKGRCSDCSRIFKPEKLTTLPNNVRVCATCLRAREQALEKKIFKQGITHVHEKHEKTKLKWLAIIAAILVLIIVINHFRH
jgi:hypothetical protein